MIAWPAFRFGPDRDRFNPSETDLGADALDRYVRRGQVTVVFGEYGVDKTILVRRFFREAEDAGKLVYVPSLSGRDIADLFQLVLEQLGYSVEVERTANTSVTAEGGVDLFVVRARAGVVSEAGAREELVVSSPTDARVIELMSQNQLVLVFDEVHKAPDQLRQQLADLIKSVRGANTEFPVIALIGTTMDAEQLVRNDPGIDWFVKELLVVPLSDAEARCIVEEGFRSLTVTIEPEIVERTVRTATGAPTIVQKVCLDMAENALRDGRDVVIPDDHSNAILLYIADIQPHLATASTRAIRSQAIPLCELATREDFETDGYLWANEDVANAAMQASDPEFALHHFLSFGAREGRLQLRSDRLPRVESLRKAKLEVLWKRSPGSRASLERYRTVSRGLDLDLWKVFGETQLPVPFERVSAHDYDAPTQAWFDDHPEWLFLDVGAGLRPLYRPNVIYAEIAALPSTDVLCFGDSLPFDDSVFDGVVSLSVLEHVPDPFSVAGELIRVVKPGCTIIIDWPFLQPVHGYPHHYFNATEQGARQAFARLDRVGEVRSSIPSFLHPVYTLRWILDEWQQGLPATERPEFLGLTVADVLSQDSGELVKLPWAAALPASRQGVISAGTRLEITKR